MCLIPNLQQIPTKKKDYDNFCNLALKALSKPIMPPFKSAFDQV